MSLKKLNIDIWMVFLAESMWEELSGKKCTEK